MRSGAVTWHDSLVSRSGRCAALGDGATIWLTGLPASGKSTLAMLLEQRMIGAERAAYVLDGDNLRHGLNSDLGFDEGSRAENVRRAAHVAKLFADSGIVAIVSLISPYQDGRDQARLIHEQARIPFIEVFVDTPLEECERRDPKGLYAKARRGEILAFTGVSDPYERPENPDVVVSAAAVSAPDAVDLVLGALEARR